MISGMDEIGFSCWEECSCSSLHEFWFGFGLGWLYAR